jgi:diguanylate cyclase (GGDEF)-like protein/PAS domain S-box-containing protein
VITVFILGACVIGLIVAIVIVDGRRRLRTKRIAADYQRRARYEAIVEQGSDLIALSSADGTMLYLSPSHHRLLGSDRTKPDPVSLTSLIPDDDLAVFVELLERAVARGHSGPADTRIRHADGSMRTIETTVTDMRKVPEVASLVWIGRDVTERRRLEDLLALAASEASDRGEKLADAQRLALLGSWEWDVDLEQLNWSEELIRLLAAGDEFDASVDGVLDRVHPDDRGQFQAALDRTLETGTPLELDVRIHDLRDNLRWVQMRGAATRWDGDRVVLMSGTAQDVTKRRNAEDALRVSEERFRILAETASDAIVSASADSIIESFNHAAEQMFGITEADAIGASLTALMPERFHQPHADGMARYLTGGEARAVGKTTELVGRHSSGAEFPIEVSIAYWSVGAERHFTGIIRDIAERKQADAELRTANSVLAATLESTADGILVTDLDGRVTSVNRQFGDMWLLPDSIARSGDGRVVRDAAREQLIDPEGFAIKLSEIHHQPDASSLDTLEFKDGRVFERFCAPQRVDGTIIGRVWSFRDVTDRKRLEDELAHQAFHDSLTNLANQALFRDRVDLALLRLTRSGSSLSVLFLDLDNFKSVNDSLGHTAGDQLLVAVSRRLGGCLRPGDTAARLGGDEFAVLLDETSSRRDAISVAERIIAAIRMPVALGEKEVVITASIGIAFGCSETAGDQLLRNADLAMYTAKSRGKARYELFEPEMHRAALERLEVEADLRMACARDELVVHYQPIIDLGTGAISGVEALVRWQHPTNGLLQPDAFIAIAEESGVIDDIGRHVLEIACTQVRKWQLQFVDHRSMSASVNLSPRQLLEPGLVGNVKAALAKSGLAPGCLMLEITEGAMMQDPDAAVDQLQALKAVGVQLAIDDFGIGHSSLSYLQRFPIDVLKIDKSFVWNIDRGPEESALARAIVRLAQSLHLTAVAEGVETPAQAALLRELGCDSAQGFYYARPVEASALSKLLEHRESVVA